MYIESCNINKYNINKKMQVAEHGIDIQSYAKVYKFTID